jgi:hypothetical protein
MRYRPAPANAPALGTLAIEWMRNHFLIQAHVARAAGARPDHLNRMLKGAVDWDEELFGRVCRLAGIPAELVAIVRATAPQSIAS